MYINGQWIINDLYDLIFDEWARLKNIKTNEIIKLLKVIFNLKILSLLRETVLKWHG